MRGKIVSKKLQTFSPLPRVGKPFGKPYRVKKKGGWECNGLSRNGRGKEVRERRARREEKWSVIRRAARVRGGGGHFPIKSESGYLNKLLRVDFSNEKARIA